MKNKIKNGFTLIELLFVIAIIAILAAMLLPALQTAKQKANETVDMNNIKQFETAFQMYAQDNYQNFPVSYGQYTNALFPPGDNNLSPGVYPSIGTRTIYPDYINNAKVFWSPGAINRGVPPPTGPIIGKSDTLGSSTYQNEWYASYAFTFGLTIGNTLSVPVPMISDRPENFPDGINVGYIDGSAAWIPISQVIWANNTFAGNPNVACQSDGWGLNVFDNTSWGQ